MTRAGSAHNASAASRRATRSAAHTAGARALVGSQNHYARETTATRLCDWRCRAMRDEAEYYRQRAVHCRELAKSARDPLAVERLMELAADFEVEANRLDPALDNEDKEKRDAAD